MGAAVAGDHLNDMTPFPQAAEFANLMIEDMCDGMLSFSGYMIGVSSDSLSPVILAIIKERAVKVDGIFADDQTAAQIDKTNNPSKLFAKYLKGNVVSMMIDYEIEFDGTELSCRMIIDPCENDHSVEVVCYRDPILNYPDPKAALFAHIEDLKSLFNRLNARALFVGPDCSKYPKDEKSYPDCWRLIS